MQKIKIIVDSPSDIPDEDLARYNIKMVGVPIQVDGETYIERENLTCREFYPILEAAQELPTTSRVSFGTFYAEFVAAFKEGFADAIVITINAGGSGTHESAQLAAKTLFSDFPEAIGAFSIHIVDSMTYAIAYGYPTMQAAAMAEEGKSVEEILAYLRDFFCRVEISLVCFTLEYAKRSGRITAAAALAGDVLGLRPTIAMIDGTTAITSKVRGDRRATKKLLESYRKRRVNPDDIVLIVSAAVDEYGQELENELKKELGREIPHYKAGAAITINAGPRISALCFLGKKRERDEINQPSVITFNGLA